MRFWEVQKENGKKREKREKKNTEQLENLDKQRAGVPIFCGSFSQFFSLSLFFFSAIFLLFSDQKQLICWAEADKTNGLMYFFGK